MVQIQHKYKYKYKYKYKHIFKEKDKASNRWFKYKYKYKREREIIKQVVVFCAIAATLKAGRAQQVRFSCTRPGRPRMDNRVVISPGVEKSHASLCTCGAQLGGDLIQQQC